MYGHPQFVRFLSEQLTQTVLDVIDQDGTPVLRTPHDVVLQGEDGTGVFCVALVHAYDYTRGSYLFHEVALYQHRRAGDSPVA